jgi:hypothetical protein
MTLQPAADFPFRFRQALIQAGMTLIVLAFVPGTVAKALCLLTFWALLFWPLRLSELLTAAGICVFFTGMNASALQQGIFRFREADVLGMPVYELFMWGFYLTHAHRLWRGVPTVKPQPRLAWGLGLAFSAAFALITDQGVLFGITAVLLAVALFFFHEPMDLAYAAHMVVLGALIEYVGVHAGQWSYPIDVPGGVPPWFVTMWGGVGLFFRRLVMPWLPRPN